MFLGHFAVALGAKKIAPKASLGTLLLGAQLADLVWPVFLLLGWERVQIAPGITRVTPLDFVSYPYSHSLLAQALWATLLGGVYYAARRDARGAIVLSLCVPSHWLLDFISHRPDMPLVPGGTRYGLGLWNYPAATVIFEFALFAAGVAIYHGAVRRKQGQRRYALWSLLILLSLLYIGSVVGPPPPDTRTLAFSALAIWLTVPWAAWADRQRRPRGLASQPD
jgi:membrane-bound metal-dependent hydrolase YbcI (DUF457 family)